MRVVTGYTVSLEGIPTQGMLDCDLFRILLQTAFAEPEPFGQILPALIAEAQQQYFLDCPPNLHSCVCPGAVRFLESLKEADVPCAIVSGNLRAIGWKKLELAGLRPYFFAGAFAEDGITRAQLVSKVLSQVLGDGPLSDASVSLIGDHPNDVRAARANGIRAIAVATGLSSSEELSREQPDILFEDLTAASVNHVL